MLLTRIDPKISEDEIKKCLSKFDLNGDKKISFYEFCKTINRITGESPMRRHSIPQRLL